MKYSRAIEQACCIMGRVADASLHGEVVTNDQLSANLAMSPSYIKKITHKLVAANLIAPTYGSRGGFSLTNSDMQRITLLDVVVAIEGDAPLFQPTGLVEKVFKKHTDLAKIGLTHVEKVFRNSEKRAMDEMKKLTLAKLIKELKYDENV